MAWQQGTGGRAWQAVPWQQGEGLAGCGMATRGAHSHLVREVHADERVLAFPQFLHHDVRQNLRHDLGAIGAVSGVHETKQAVFKIKARQLPVTAHDEKIRFLAKIGAG